MVCENRAFRAKRIRLTSHEAGKVCFIRDQLEALGSFVFLGGFFVPFSSPGPRVEPWAVNEKAREGRCWGGGGFLVMEIHKICIFKGFI